MRPALPRRRPTAGRARRPRLVLQLTPLLDLLLIALFAQQIDTRIAAARAVDSQASRAEAALTRLAASETRRDTLAARNDELRVALAGMRAEIARLETALAEAETRARARERARRRAAAESAMTALARLLDMPPEALAAAVPATRLPAARAERLAASLAALAEAPPGAPPARLAERLAALDGLAEIVTLWHLELRDGDRLVLRAGGRPVAALDARARDAGALTAALMRAAARRARPAPGRPLILLYSFGNATRAARRHVERAGPELARALEARWPDLPDSLFVPLGWRAGP